MGRAEPHARIYGRLRLHKVALEAQTSGKAISAKGLLCPQGGRSIAARVGGKTLAVVKLVFRSKKQVEEAEVDRQQALQPFVDHISLWPGALRTRLLEVDEAESEPSPRGLDQHSDLGHTLVKVG